MSGRKLLDTNQLSDVLDPRSTLRDWIDFEIARGIVVGTCVPVLCEIESGLFGLRESVAARRRIRIALRDVRVWPIDDRLPAIFGPIAADLRARGRVLSPIDIMLAALCRQMNATLVTADRDFEALPWLTTGKWLA